MSARKQAAAPFEDFHLGEPVVFSAPPPEVMAELRRLLPPASPELQSEPERAA